MKTIRYSLLMLFVLAPGLAFAQLAADSLILAFAGEEYPAIAPNWVHQLEEGEVLGPFPMTVAEPALGCVLDPDNPDADANGYVPLITNTEEVAGTFVIIARGECTFVAKVKAAFDAGAEGIILWSATTEATPDAFPAIGGAPEPRTDIPAAFVSYNTGQAALQAAKFGDEATFIQTYTGPAFPPPPPASSVGVHTTGAMTVSVYDYGFLGANALFAQEGDGLPFAFGDVEGGLFVSSVLVGQGGVVNTNPYAQGPPEFVNVSPVAPITPPTPFNQAFQTSYSSAELGVLVTQRSYSGADDPFVIVELEVENTSGSALSGVHIGLFADWDAGTTSVDDEAGVNSALNLVYVYDPVEDQPYYGVVARVPGGGLSGYNADASDADDAQLWEALTTEVAPAAGGVERAAVSGLGPFDIAAGTSVSVQFAYVAGADEAELFENAQAALDVEFEVAAEETTPEGTYVLESAYPNPFSARTTIGFELPVAQDVRLTVYDVLGRQVATLVDGVRQAGPQTVVFDASSLPSGMYIYRLEAGSTQLMERVTLVR